MDDDWGYPYFRKPQLQLHPEVSETLSNLTLPQTLWQIYAKPIGESAVYMIYNRHLGLIQAHPGELANIVLLLKTVALK